MHEQLAIELGHNSHAEARTREILCELARKYDLRPWLFTRTILIDQQAIPHSHPVLTLNAAESDERMVLAQYLHEQLHWFEDARATARDHAVDATKQLYPEVMAVRPDGAGDEFSTRLHLLVCTLEYDSLTQLLGADDARDVIDALSRHHYRWVYREVLANAARIRDILVAYHLWPAGLSLRPGGGA